GPVVQQQHVRADFSPTAMLLCHQGKCLDPRSSWLTRPGSEGTAGPKTIREGGPHGFVDYLLFPCSSLSLHHLLHFHHWPWWQSACSTSHFQLLNLVAHEKSDKTHVVQIRTQRRLQILLIRSNDRALGDFSQRLKY